MLFLVGPNNAGKTSLLRLMDVLFNWDLTQEFRSVSDELLAELLPARETRNAARRLTLGVSVNDGRRHGSLSCDNGIATLRLSLTLNDRRLRLNLGVARRGETHDQKAERFLGELRDTFSFVHIPAGRSADSGSFTELLLDAITESLASILRQPGKGATKAERDAKKVLESLEKLAGPAEDFWDGFLGRLPDGWIVNGSAAAGIDRDVLARFIVEQLALSLTTGAHDASGVPPSEVGSGLQSLLDLELRRFTAAGQGRHLLLAVEEPEVFLHPSAQRQLGRSLSGGQMGSRTFVSTHSPLILEEASFEQVAIIRDHVVYQTHLGEDERAAINTTLMTGRGAEVLFARSVLLVEGPGDREYWEALRRRLAFFDASGSVDHCYVLDVGSNSRFAPWIRLFRAFPTLPIRWLAVLDSDSVKEIREAASHAGLRLSERQRTAFRDLKAAVDANDLSSVEQVARGLATLAPKETPLLMVPGDLESLMCSKMSSETSLAVCEAIGFERLPTSQLAERLGTKHRAGGKAIDRPKKAPWMRAVIGRVTPASELDSFTSGILETWVGAVAGSDHGAQVVSKFISDG